jgi:hypothetical protein
LKKPVAGANLLKRRKRMSYGPDGLVLRFMHQVHTKSDRVIDDLGDLAVHLTNVEENLARSDWPGYLTNRQNQRNSLICFDGGSSWLSIPKCDLAGCVIERPEV